MFGYIAPVLSVLTPEQKHRYRAFYCGVCHALMNRYGRAGRISLSNDMTFLAILLSSLYEPETRESAARCVLHPAKPHPFLSSPMIDYAADMNALLFYYKCVDQRMDDRSLRGRTGEALFRSALEKVREFRPAQAEEVEDSLNLLWEEEKKPAPDPDRLCNLSGRMLGTAFVPDPKDHWSPLLRSVGESLGRFIYWMDAWDDLEEDLKKGRFNPLAAYRDRPDYREFCDETLELLIAEGARSFEYLPLEQDLELLRNIIYSGIWQKYCRKNERSRGKEEDHAE